MTEKAKRPYLTEEQITQCHDLIDDLVRLHQETDPKFGKKSQNDKQEKALQALNKVGLLTGILTEWAENQIFGGYYKVAKSEDDWIDQKECNRHENELMWYGKNLPDDVFSNERHVICERLAIGEILQNTFGRYGRMGWRMYLKECLYALNEGQVETLMQPMNTNQKGNAYDLQQLKWAAVKHIYKLVGEGWKKTAAQQKIAEQCGATFEALKKWEREGIKERDKNQTTLKVIQNGAGFINFFTEHTGANDVFDRQTILSMALDWNLNGEINKNAPSKDESYGIITALMLDEDYPLDTLKDRLIEAGMRQTA